MEDLHQQLRYERLVGQLGQIPTLPAIVSKLLVIVNHPNSNAADAAQYIEKDVGLAAKVLKLANSSYYGIPRTISNVTSAVVILGFNTIKSIILSSTVVKIFPDVHGGDLFDRKMFWKHSAEVAIISRYLARKMRSSKVDADVAFSAGLLHDVGKIILDQFLHDDYAPVIEYALANQIPLLKAEQHHLQIDHAQIGGMLLDKWGVPESLKEPVRYHHHPKTSKSRGNDLTWIVHYANELSHQLGSAVIPNLPSSPFLQAGLKHLELPELSPMLLEEVRAEMESASEFFDLILSD